MHQIKQMIKNLKQDDSLDLDAVQDMITMHDIFMYEYGWMSLEEFKKIPIPTAFNLAACINKRYELMNDKNGNKRNSTNKR